MKKVFIVFLIIVFAYASGMGASAARVERSLRIERGRAQIELRCGQKRRLRVSRGVFGLPAGGKLSFSSSDSITAYVDDSGTVHGGAPGRAYVTVTDAKGGCDSILIVVSGDKKAGSAVLPPVCILIAAAALLTVKIKNR